MLLHVFIHDFNVEFHSPNNYIEVFEYDVTQEPPSLMDIDLGGSHQINCISSLSVFCVVVNIQFSFDSFESVGYGSSCSGNVYGFSWCPVEMVLYLAVDFCSLIVPPGLVNDMCLSFASRDLGFVINFAGFDVDMHFVVHSQVFLSMGSLSCDKCFECHFATFSCKRVFLM